MVITILHHSGKCELGLAPRILATRQQLPSRAPGLWWGQNPGDKELFIDTHCLSSRARIPKMELTRSPGARMSHRVRRANPLMVCMSVLTPNQRRRRTYIYSGFWKALALDTRAPRQLLCLAGSVGKGSGRERFLHRWAALSWSSQGCQLQVPTAGVLTEPWREDFLCDEPWGEGQSLLSLYHF